MHHPVVVFPHPDSPTNASVSPRMSEKDTPSTACTLPVGRPNTVRNAGNDLKSPSTSTSGGAALRLSPLAAVSTALGVTPAGPRQREPGVRQSGATARQPNGTGTNGARRVGKVEELLARTGTRRAHSALESGSRPAMPSPAVRSPVCQSSAWRRPHRAPAAEWSAAKPRCRDDAQP